MRHIAISFAFVAISTFSSSFAQTMVAPEQPGMVFESFEVNPQNQKALRFRFSRSPATSKFPVIISAVGRELNAKGREHRVELQKVWLGQNVPKDYHLVLRTLDECEFKQNGEFAGCDHYSFEDPNTKKRFDYYIYVGNWP